MKSTAALAVVFLFLLVTVLAHLVGIVTAVAAQGVTA